MIYAVFDEADTLVIDRNNISTVIEKRSLYGIPRIIQIESDFDANLKVGSKCQLARVEDVALEMIVLEVNPSVTNRVLYRFVNKIQYDIETSKISTNANILNVSFKSYIIGTEPQRNFLLREIRKKGLVLIDEDNVSQSKPVQELMNGSISEINSNNYFYSTCTKSKRQRFYSLGVGEVVSATRRNEEFMNYTPFLFYSNVRSMSTYVEPVALLKYQTNVNIVSGDTIDFFGEKSIVIETKKYFTKESAESHLLVGQINK